MIMICNFIASSPLTLLDESQLWTRKWLSHDCGNPAMVKYACRLQSTQMAFMWLQEHAVNRELPVQLILVGASEGSSTYPLNCILKKPYYYLTSPHNPAFAWHHIRLSLSGPILKEVFHLLLKQALLYIHFAFGSNMEMEKKNGNGKREGYGATSKMVMNQVKVLEPIRVMEQVTERCVRWQKSKKQRKKLEKVWKMSMNERKRLNKHMGVREIETPYHLFQVLTDD